LRFFAASSENKRIAALEPDDATPGSRFRDRQPLDLVLVHSVLSGPLSNVDSLAGHRCEGDDRIARKGVVQQHLRRFEHLGGS
jgi:hypothetical protein